MAKYNFSRDGLKEACLAFDAAKVTTALADPVAPDEPHASGCIKTFKRCGAAVVRQKNPKAMAGRDAVVVALRAYLAPFPEQIAAFDAHITDAKRVEGALHDILATLNGFEITKRPADQRIWACIKLGAGEINACLKRLEETLKANTGFVMLKSPAIDAGEGRTVTVDSVVWSVTRGLTQNLNMFGHREKLFEANTGDLVIPAHVEVDDALASEAFQLYYMELSWTDVLTGWDRVRLFDGTVTSGSEKVKFEPSPDKIEIELLQFGAPTKWELYDAVAVSRLNQNLFQHAKDLRIFAEKYESVKSLEAGPVALPGPGTFISVDEIVAFYLFEQVLFLPVREDKDHGGGLSLRQWLRGYSCLGQLCWDGDKPAADARLLTKDELVAGLTRGGFTEADAGTFIRHATFGRAARDLMDNPLVRTADGKYMLFAPGFRSPVYTTIIMSRLAAFKPDFSDKGRKFEVAVQKQFADVGVPAKTFKYKVADTQYDCDVAALWGKTLFVFECKNHGLAFGHLPSLHEFHREFWHAAKQALRTKEFLETHPETVREHFGADAKWERIVACVLYATPWAIGKMTKKLELYSYDASALGKFLGQGTIALESHRTIAGANLVRRHRFRLWKGEKPDDDDLMRQLAEPVQLKMERASRIIESMVRDTAKLKGVALPNWKTQEQTPEQTLRAMGVEEEEVAQILKHMDEFHAVADAIERRRGKHARKKGADAKKPKIPWRK